MDYLIGSNYDGKEISQKITGSFSGSRNNIRFIQSMSFQYKEDYLIMLKCDYNSGTLHIRLKGKQFSLDRNLNKIFKHWAPAKKFVIFLLETLEQWKNKEQNK